MSNDVHQLPLNELHLERKRFYNKEEIKPWVRDTLYRFGRISVVVARSDTHKIIFKCKVSSSNELPEKPGNGTQRRRRPTTCPFKLRANYSIKNGYWNLSVINDTHDHPIPDRYSAGSNLSTPEENGNVDTESVRTKTVTNGVSNAGNDINRAENNDTGNAQRNVPTSAESPMTETTYPRVDDLFNPSPGDAPQLSISSTVPSNSNSVFSNFVDTATPMNSAISDNSSPRKEKELPNATYGSQASYFVSSSPPKRKIVKPTSNKKAKATKLPEPALKPASETNAVRGAYDLKSPDEVAFFLRQELNKLIQYNVVKNDYMSEKIKVSLLDSITSQFILDHKSILSAQFIESLQQNNPKPKLESKALNRGGASEGTRKFDEGKSQQHKHKHKQNRRQSQAQIQKLQQNRETSTQQQYQQRKSILNSWLAAPGPAANGLVSNPSTNLIPLSPLLNDSDNEYSGAGPNSGLTNTIENLTNSAYQSNAQASNNAMLGSNPSMMKNQVLQIQNQSQQLPSFNSIQNQLPLSPGNSSSLMSFGNTNGASLIPPINNNSNSNSNNNGSNNNNNNNTTLNPSHLLIGSGSKNNILNLGGQLSSGNLFNDMKLGGSIPLTLNAGMNGSSGSYRSRNNNPTSTNTTSNANPLNNIGNSSNDPTSQQLNQLNASSFFSGMTSIGPNNSGNFQGNNTSGFNIRDTHSGTTSASLLNNMSNFTDPGW